MAVLPIFSYVTAHLYLKYAVGSRNQPYIPTREPDIGKLYLHTINYHLLEKAVLIADGKSRCGIIKRRKRVHKASGKSSKTSVAQTCVRLALVNIIKGVSEFLKRLLVFV